MKNIKPDAIKDLDCDTATDPKGALSHFFSQSPFSDMEHDLRRNAEGLGKVVDRPTISSVREKIENLSLKPDAAAQAVKYARRGRNARKADMDNCVFNGLRLPPGLEPELLLKPKISSEEVTIDRVFMRASEIFGSYENAVDWLTATIPALGNKRPIDLLDSTTGIQTVLNVLGRIERGMPS